MHVLPQIKRVLEPSDQSESPTSPIGEIETSSNATNYVT